MSLEPGSTSRQEMMSVLGPSSNVDKCIENNDMLIDVNNDEGNSIKTAFLTFMEQRTGNVCMEITLEENTCEGGEDRENVLPAPAPEVTPRPISTRGSVEVGGGGRGGSIYGRSRYL